MCVLIFGEGFLASVKKLGKKIILKVSENLKLLQQNLFNSKLHTKPLHGKLAGFYSFRIGRDYRIIFRFLNNRTILLITASHRKEIYK